LVVLSISGKSINLGERFPILPKLKSLTLNLKEVSSLKQISLCYKLQELFLNGLNLEELPTDISRLKQLKNINLQRLNKLKNIPTFAAAENLETLSLMILPALDRMEIDFSQMQALQNLKIQNVSTEHGTFELSDSLSQCKKLKKLTLTSSPITDLPSGLENLSILENLSLGILPLKEIPDIFMDMTALNYLQIARCDEVEKLPSSIRNLKSLKHFQLHGLPKLENLELDFYPLENLESITIADCVGLKKIDPSLAQNTSIKKISLTRLPELSELPPFGRRNLRLELLGMRDLPQLTNLPESITTLPALQQLTAYNIGIEKLPANIDELKSLIRLELFAENLSHLPLKIAHLNSLNRFTLKTAFTKKDEKIIMVHDLYPALNKQTDDDVKRAILYWIGNGYMVLPLTSELKENTLKALHWSVKNLHLLLLSRIHFFNQGNKKILSTDLNKNKKIWINGALSGNKTIFKNKLKELGLKVESKFSDQTEIVVIGRKPAIPVGLFNRPLQFASQLEIEEIIKTINPGFLQKKDVPENFIHNLQELLWSADPQNESVALELVKANGLPESVEEDFLLVAKVCKDKNLKNRIRTFLKGRVSEAKQKAITTGSAPFSIEKLNRVLPSESLTKMYYALFKRTRMADPNFFIHDNGGHSGRAEVFQQLLPKFLENFGYFKNNLPLLEEEYNLIFQQPGFLGNLKRIGTNFTRCEKLPESLLKHASTLKTLRFSISENFAVDSIYPFDKINTLNIIGDIKDIPSGIGSLTRLRIFNISSEKPFTLPPDFSELKKLKSVSLSRLTNREDFLEHFPHLLT